jgi:hypothetical protein
LLLHLRRGALQGSWLHRHPERCSMYEGTIRHRLQGCCPRCKKQLVVQQYHCAEYPDSIVQHVRNMLFGQMELIIGKHLEQEHGEYHMAASYYHQPTRYVDNNQVIRNQTYYYTDSTATCTNTVTTSSADTWTHWMGYDTGSSSGNTVWVIWSSDDSSRFRERYQGEWVPTEQQQRMYDSQYSSRARNTETDNERVQRQERERVAAEASAAAAQAEKEKEARARQLLREVLTEEQNKELDKRGYFELGVVGGARYRIKKGNAYNVEKLDQQGKVIEKLCFNLPGCHHYDTMVMQKLMLETDEQGTYKFANKQRVANA